MPFTLPLLLGMLGGTGIGAGIAANVNLIYVIATGYFILGIGVGLYLLNRRAKKHQEAFSEVPLQNREVKQHQKRSDPGIG